MGKPALVALYSPAPRSGKSTVAAHLDAAHGYAVHSFAAPLKRMAEALLASTGYLDEVHADISSGCLKDSPIPDLGITGRGIQVLLGEAFREKVAPDFWVKVLARRIANQCGLGRPIVIDDLRRPNEYEWLRKAGAKIIKVVRPDTPRFVQGEGLLDHCRFDWTITNDGSLRQLRASVDDFLETFKT